MSIWDIFTNPPLFGNLSKLCTACEEGDLATVRALATANLVNSVGWMGWAPLHKASQSGHSEIVEYLLVQPDLKTDVNIRDNDKHTPLMLACGISNESIKESHLKSIHLLLAGGADVNAEDDGGYTSLDLAVINNNIEAVKLLLEYKCNINHQNQDKFTPLHYACRYQFQEIANLLVRAGADLSIPDDHGRTAVQLAQRYSVNLTLGPSSQETSIPKPSSLTDEQSTLIQPNQPNLQNVTQSSQNIIESKDQATQKIIEAQDQGAQSVTESNEQTAPEIATESKEQSEDIDNITKLLQAELAAQIENETDSIS